MMQLKNIELLLFGFITSVMCGCTASKIHRANDAFGDMGGCEVGLNIGSKITHWDTQFTDQQRFVPYHPDEAAAGSGGAYLDADGTLAPVYFGAHAGIGVEEFTLYGGLDFRANPISLFDIAYIFDGLFRATSKADPYEDDTDNPRQDSQRKIVDVHDLSYNGSDTEAYSIFSPRNLTNMPKIGIRWNPIENIQLSLEYGRPHTKFTYEKGYVRHGEMEPIYRENWQGWGHMYGVQLLLGPDESFRWGLEYRRERYSAAFSSEDVGIRGNIYSIFLEWTL